MRKRLIASLASLNCVPSLVHAGRRDEAAAVVRAALPGPRSQMPQSVGLTPVNDRSVSIRDALHDVTLTMFGTIVLVVLVIFIFLRRVAATLIPALSLPVSLIGALSLLYAGGYSLSNVSLLGIPLGVYLRLSDRGGVLENGAANKIVGGVVNAVRSTPFIILLVAIIPFTRFITGSSIGTAAAVVPLTIAAAPFVARLVEAALREVDHGLVEAAQAMGATTSQIVWKVLLPEALPGIVAGLTITFVSLTGYSAMAGAIGGGGLGDLGIRYGYQRFLPEIMLAVVLVLIFFVQAVQSLGDWAVRRLSHR